MIDLTKNITEAEDALVSKPLFATSVERVMILNELKSKYKELPAPKRFARFFSELLSRVSVPLEPYDLVAGRCVDRELSDEEEAVYQSFIKDPEHPKRTVWTSSGHCMYDWDMLAREGIPGLRARVTESLSHESDPEKRIFYESIVEVYDTITAYLLRYAEAARKKGMNDLAEICTKAATERPTSFTVALQLLWTVTFINCAYITENPTLTVGRLDRILLPFYRSDLESGKLTEEEARAYITDYYCKHNLIMGRGEHQIGDETNSTTFQRICNFDAPQYLLLAGTDKEGASTVNELTMLFAECIRPKFKNPVIVVRYFVGMDKAHPELWRVLSEKALESSSLMFYNDTNVRSTFTRMGFTPDDFSEYYHFGCNWPCLGTNSVWMQSAPTSVKYNVYTSPEEKERVRNPFMRTGGTYGWPEIIVNVLREFAEREEGSVTIDDFYVAFESYTRGFIERKLSRAAAELEVRRRRPARVLIFGDCFLDRSLSEGGCITAVSKYHFELQPFQMFGTLVDSLITIDKLVFIDRILTLKELITAVDANFEGYEEILALCRKVPKYGSDTEHSNLHVRRLSRLASDLAIEGSLAYKNENLFLMPCTQSDTWHVKYGEKYGATPDGRLAHTPFSQNSRPSNGACINGLSAMLNSMLCLPSDGFLSGALNLDVDPKQFAGEAGRERFASLLATYFNAGGLHAQVSTTSVEELRAAKIDPDRYRDLRVRVTGYSGVFVDIPERLQNDIINRFS